MPNQKSKETLLVEELYDIKMQLREAQDKLWKATAERASWELDAKLRLDLAEADLARVTAERDNYQSDIDRYAWNLVSCEQIASGWVEPGDYNKEIALRALDSVSRMAQDLVIHRNLLAQRDAENKETLDTAVKLEDECNALRARVAELETALTTATNELQRATVVIDGHPSVSHNLMLHLLDVIARSKSTTPAKHPDTELLDSFEAMHGSLGYCDADEAPASWCAYGYAGHPEGIGHTLREAIADAARKQGGEVMSPGAQRIAIAEVCNYRHGECKPFWMATPVGQPFVACSVDKLPDYLNDLNAMHEAELLLDSTCLQSYMENLVVACLGNSASGDGSIEEQWIVCHASASLRAKAFLQTWGKWHE